MNFAVSLPLEDIQILFFEKSLKCLKVLWLPASDHRREGTFQWMWNMKEVAVGSWAPGMPSVNRTANCLAINRFGHFMEESCHSSGRRYHTLCEAKNFDYRNRDDSDIRIKQNNFSNAIINDDAEINNQLIHEQRQTLTLIGNVGNIMYFTNNQTVGLLFINHP